VGKMRWHAILERHHPQLNRVAQVFVDELLNALPPRHWALADRMRQTSQN